MHDVAVFVAEHLHLDVARRDDVFLDQHPGVAECRRALARGQFQRGFEVHMRVDPPHAAPAAARDRLDQDGVADLVGLLLQEFRALVVAVIARHDRRARLDHQRLGGALEPHRAHRRSRRPDEGDARAFAALGEFRVLAQETVAGMQALSARREGRLDDRLAVEVALRPLPHFDRLVRHPREQSAAIGGRVQGDRAKPHPRRGSDDAASDLATVGDQDVGEHGVSPDVRAAIAALPRNRNCRSQGAAQALRPGRPRRLRLCARGFREHRSPTRNPRAPANPGPMRPNPPKAIGPSDSQAGADPFEPCAAAFAFLIHVAATGIRISADTRTRMIAIVKT